jgi:predicted AlkP superfamily pyrophosphatase or phosphodiesterase
MKNLTLLISLVVLLQSSQGHAMSFDQYKQRPKLVVVLVIDQFRADFLRRFEKTFMQAKNKTEYGGFNYLMKNSAFFPSAEYEVLQSMTCPGHAMIMTGAYPRDNGVVLNEWYDKKQDKKVYCVGDEKYKLSPSFLKATTLGDELKNVDKNSRVFTLALKDRSAIMLGGHRADLALWIDNDEMKWATSSFYSEKLPGWVDQENSRLISEYKISKENSKEAKKDFATYLGVKVTTDLAIKAVNEENLGKSDSTDILAVSFSTHDMTGHTNGPDSLEVKVITHVEDRQISRLINAINKKLGSLKDVVFVLTGDHGIAPNVETALANKINSGKIDYGIVYKKVNEFLNNRFGVIKGNWIQGHRSLHLYLNEAVIKSKALSLDAVETEVANALKGFPGIRNVVSSEDIRKGVYPIGDYSEQLKNQYIAGISGDLIIIPEPFFMEQDDNCVTHITGYSYDRTVPLLISGKNVVNGVYAGAKIVDLAPTLSHLLHILPPSNSSGRVLPIFK